MRRSLPLSLVLCLSACPDRDSGDGDGSSSTGSDPSTGPGATGTTVTWVVYVDAACQALPPKDSTTTVDTTVACNVTGDGSVSDVVCHADHITYTNHPNSPDCSTPGVAIMLPVGVCQQFPGPVETWKRIDPDTYDCAS